MAFIETVPRVEHPGEARPNKMEGRARGSAARCVSYHPTSRASNKQNAGIRNFVVSTTLSVAADEENMRRQKVYLDKLNLLLVQVGGILG